MSEARDLATNRDIETADLAWLEARLEEYRDLLQYLRSRILGWVSKSTGESVPVTIGSTSRTIGTVSTLLCRSVEELEDPAESTPSRQAGGTGTTS